MFMALTTADGEVRMFPNMPAFGVLLGLLVLFLGALLALLVVPGWRRGMRMPHAVGCLAEIIGYLIPIGNGNGNGRDSGEMLLKGCLSREEMLERLGAGGGSVGKGEQSRWAFGFGDGVGVNGGVGGEGELGVRRVRRFTEKRRVRKSQIGRALLR